MLSEEEQNTLGTYNKISSDWTARRLGEDDYWAEDKEKFKSLLPKGKVIDIGCGPGADCFWFMENGYEYIGIDGSEEMIRIARTRNPKAKFEVRNFYELEDIKEKFNGFWACASLLHVEKARIAEVLKSIKKMLLPESVGFISLKAGSGEENTFWKETGLQRHFVYYERKEFTDFLSSAGFSVLMTGRQKSKRDKATEWLTFFVKN